MHRTRSAMASLAVCAAALLVAGCASLNSVAVDVSSQGSWPADRKPGSYAVERLPSQQANAAEQDRIEAAALPALEAAGFTRVPLEQADVLVQVGARVFEVSRRDPYMSHWAGATTGGSTAGAAHSSMGPAMATRRASGMTTTTSRITSARSAS